MSSNFFCILAVTACTAAGTQTVSSADTDAEKIGPSSRRTALAISEMMYHPPARADGLNLEYIEIYNSQPWFQDISGYRLKGDIDFTFPSNTVLEARSYLVIAQSPTELQQVCPITNVIGSYSGRLPGDKGHVRLEHRSGAVLLEVRYRDGEPWPMGADGTGHSIVLSRPSLGEADPRAWDLSASIGGSPGAAEPEQSTRPVVINEFRASSAAEPGFVELFNQSGSPVDLSGWILTDDFSLNKFRIPAQTTLQPGQFLVYTDQNCGFKLRTSGESIYLLDANRTMVVDAVRYGPQASPKSTGRHPNGTGPFRRLAAPTPGTGNSWLDVGPVVINEIMYAPISGDDQDEYIELYNWTEQSVDVSGWALSDGVSFMFPAGALLAPGSYLVVAKDTARLKANYTHLSSQQVYGNYDGTLANGGERLALSRPGASPGERIVVDEVNYGVGGRWGQWAHGGGSSLELVNPLADHQAPDSWADSDESGKAPWTLVQWTGVLTNYGANVSPISGVNVILLGSGQCLLDNIEVLKDAPLNVVSNGTFEAGLAGWSGQGNHSRIEPAENGFEGRGLKLTATGRGDPGPNRLRGKLSSPLATGKTATLRAYARWLAGNPELLVRIPGNYLEAYGRLNVPANLGTPGLPNSRYVPNPAPAIQNVRHSPVLPGTNDPIVISAQVGDALGISGVTAWYRIDPDTNYTAVDLNDQGQAGDRLAGDGTWSGEIPAQAAGKLVAFYLAASNSNAAPATVLFPAGAPQRECLVRVGETATTNEFGTYRLWLTKATADRWSKREVTSNDPLAVTFVYGDSRTIYSASAYYAGSKYNPNYDSPTGRPCDYTLLFPEDDLLLGTTDFRISWPGNLNSGTDGTLQAEQACFKIVEELGAPFNHRRHVNFFVNGVRRNALLEDAQRPSGELIDEWFPDDNEGDLYKIQVHYEPSGDAAAQFTAVRRAGLGQVPVAEGASRPSYYRWNWPKRAVKTSANDYDALFQLIDAANLAETNDYTAQMEALVDIDEWMRILAAEHTVGNWDSFGYSDGSNMYFYKPSRGKWRLCIWDMDLGLDQYSDGPTTDIFTMKNGFGNLQADAVTQKFFKHPPFRRAYLRALDLVVTEIAPRLPALINAKQTAFARNGIKAGSPAALLTYLANRRTFITTQLKKYNVPFAVSDSLLEATNECVTITGTASYRLESVRINTAKCPVTWTSVTNWSATVRLTTLTNQLQVVGYGAQGQALEGMTAEVTAIYTGPGVLEEPRLVINEWMAANTRTVADPADGHYDDWFELHNPNEFPVNLLGYRVTDDTNNPAKFAFPSGVIIPAHGQLLVWADEEGSQFAATGQVHVNFKLSREGETLALYGPSGRLQDLVVFGAQQPDVSEGRTPDGDTSGFGPLQVASPGAANQGGNPPAPVVLQYGRDQAGQLTLSWNAIPGQAYQVEYQTNLDQAIWMQGESLSAQSDQPTISVPVNGAGAVFYRVRIVR